MQGTLEPLLVIDSSSIVFFFIIIFFLSPSAAREYTRDSIRDTVPFNPRARARAHVTRTVGRANSLWDTVIRRPRDSGRFSDSVAADAGPHDHRQPGDLQGSRSLTCSLARSRACNVTVGAAGLCSGARGGTRTRRRLLVSSLTVRRRPQAREKRRGYSRERIVVVRQERQFEDSSRDRGFSNIV